VTQLHFFDNFVTVSFSEEAGIDDLRDQVISVLQTRLPMHKPDFAEGPVEKKVQKRTDSPELLKIEEILDTHVRDYLQSDGGDLEVIDFKDKVLTIQYQGACGTCPSSVYGTLNAIQSILRDEMDPEISVELF